MTRSSLTADLRGLGLAEGEAVMIHAAFGRVGPVLGGPDTLVDAVLDVIGMDGTLLSYQDWELSVDVWDSEGRIRDEFRDHVPPFDPKTARPARDHGIIAATVGTRQGCAAAATPARRWRHWAPAPRTSPLTTRWTTATARTRRSPVSWRPEAAC
ncbi:hypothetical protein GCM10029992_43070 [Glycomyces albus]